jgi:geranylgeranyl diphosphate synthase, type I
VLALLWCEACSNDFRPAISVAVAYELAHASALVQDDIIDCSDKRRGRESIVKKYGLQNAILASDLLLFNVPKMLARYDYLETKKMARLFDLVGEACRGATWGEFLDLEMAKRQAISESDYEEMISSKTATLLSCPSASGAIVGGSDGLVEPAHLFGKWLGMAYQVHDDILDVFASEEILGKPIFTDFKGGKKNLVLIHALSKCSQREGDFLRSLLNRTVRGYDKEEISEARSIFESYNSLAYAQFRAEQYVTQAQNILAAIPDSKAKERLLELSEYLSNRSH